MDASSLLTSQHFTVYIGENAYGFAKVSNISAELEYDSVIEGGRNTHPLLFRKAKGKQDVMTLEKGVRLTASGAAVSLNVGTKVSGVMIGIRKDKKECLDFTFDEGIVTKAEISNLDAMGHEVLIKKMEIAHTGLRQIKKNR